MKFQVSKSIALGSIFLWSLSALSADLKVGDAVIYRHDQMYQGKLLEKDGAFDKATIHSIAADGTIQLDFGRGGFIEPIPKTDNGKLALAQGCIKDDCIGDKVLVKDKDGQSFKGEIAAIFPSGDFVVGRKGYVDAYKIDKDHKIPGGSYTDYSFVSKNGLTKTGSTIKGHVNHIVKQIQSFGKKEGPKSGVSDRAQKVPTGNTAFPSAGVSAPSTQTTGTSAK